MKILVVNGPNINMLGIREVGIYGEKSYKALLELIKQIAIEENIIIDEYQSNHEGDIIDKIQEAYNKYDGIVINPAGYTHTSIAILDALKAVQIPTIEVHISKVSNRESFRQISYVSSYAYEKIEGKGILGYKEAILSLKKKIISNDNLK